MTFSEFCDAFAKKQKEHLFSKTALRYLYDYYDELGELEFVDVSAIEKEWVELYKEEGKIDDTYSIQLENKCYLLNRVPVLEVSLEGIK